MAGSYLEKVRARTRAASNNICVGMDPLPERIPGAGDAPDRVLRFFSDMLDSWEAADVFPAAVKPNIAFYEALGIPGLEVLQELIKRCRGLGLLVVLDAKRGDIGSTSGAYARMAFEAFGADSVTVAPYMGLDSVAPFQQVSKAQGIYVLVRTSNPSARDFQELETLYEGAAMPLFEAVADAVGRWQDGNLGAVVGATAPRQLAGMLEKWHAMGVEVPLLIPGIAVAGVQGGQAGSLSEVFRLLRQSPSDSSLHLINSSGGINYAYEKYPSLSPAAASLKALEELIELNARALG